MARSERHPHAKKFVEVVRKDRDKAKPLQKRHGVVESQLQDAPVEREPAELPVHREAGIKRKIR
jgi:hypothetical protein